MERSDLCFAGQAGRPVGTEVVIDMLVSPPVAGDLDRKLSN
jgi:hypothetical protein